MALTVAEVSHPNAAQTQFDLGPFRAKLVDITFDNSYLTTGELLTAAALGWNQIHGAMVVYHPTTATGTLSVYAIARPNTARTQVAIQCYETAGTVDTAHKEVTSATDLSTYTGRFLVFGS